MLDAVAEARPYAFSDFYRRGRPVRQNPPPSPPQITFMITGRCSLKCRFCFARSAARRGVEIPLERLEPIFKQCRGVPKAVFLGGEPFEHPGIADIIRSASSAFTDEIEIFTNGRLLPEENDVLNRLLESMGSGENGPDLVLTLAVDRFHDERIGKLILARRISQLLDLKSRYGRKIRFNVSDSGFHPEQYLARNVIAPVLRAISPELEGYFKALKSPAEIESGFYFNPLFRQGGLSGDAGDTLPLRLSDIARGGDLVLAPDLGDPAGRERLALFTSLNAACAAPPPASSIAGHLEGRDSASPARLCRKAFKPYLKTKPAGRFITQSEEIFAVFKEFHDNAPAGWMKVAKRLLQIARDTGELVAEASSWSESVRLPFPALHALHTLLFRENHGAFERSLGIFASEFAGLLGKGVVPSAPVFVTNWVDGMARIPSASPLRFSLKEACLDTGLGYWPVETPHPLRLEVLIGPGARARWRLPGLAPALHGETGSGALSGYVRFWRIVFGETAWKLVVPKIINRIDRRFRAGSAEKMELVRALTCMEIPGKEFIQAGSGDPLLLFSFAAYDPGRGGVAWDERRLLETVLHGRWPNWEKSRVKKLKTEISARLKGLEDR
jgi:hypothetical protein